MFACKMAEKVRKEIKLNAGMHKQKDKVKKNQKLKNKNEQKDTDITNKVTSVNLGARPPPTHSLCLSL